MGRCSVCPASSKPARIDGFPDTKALISVMEQPVAYRFCYVLINAASRKSGFGGGSLDQLVRNLDDGHRQFISLSKLAISIAARAASDPLLPDFIPARSIA